MSADKGSEHKNEGESKGGGRGGRGEGGGCASMEMINMRSGSNFSHRMDFWYRAGREGRGGGGQGIFYFRQSEVRGTRRMCSRDPGRKMYFSNIGRSLRYG
jgi:hypothetical protein